jgi:predicted PurR-regulated permease PerM
MVALWHFRLAIQVFLISLAVAAAFRPWMNNLTRYGLPLRLALILVYLIVLGGLGLLFFAISSPLFVELQQLANDLAIGYQYILVVWPEGNSLQQAIAGQLPSSDLVYSSVIGEDGFVMFQTLVNTSWVVVERAGELAVILVLSVYWVGDRARFERLWLSLIRIEYRSRAREIWRNIELSTGAYIRSELVQALLAGLLLGGGYWLMGLKYPILLGLVGALVWLIPLIGAILIVIPVALVGLLESSTLAILAPLYTIIVFLVLELVVEPRFRNRQSFSGFLLILTMAAFVSQFGVLSLIIAPPVAVAIQIFFSQLIREQVFSPEARKTTPELIGLQERLTKIKAIMAADDEPSPRLASMIERLEDLVEDALAQAEPKNVSSRGAISSSDRITPVSAPVEAK